MVINIDTAKEYLKKRINVSGNFESLLRFPKFLEIETVHGCNARCTMCPIAEGSRKQCIISDNIYKKIASELIENSINIERVSLYKDGEPLLDLKLPERISVLKEGGIDNVLISTNVSLLNESKAKEILKAGIDTVIMSIDSIKKKCYENIRKGLKYEEVIENAIKFIKLRNTIRPQTKIWIRMILQEENIDEWPQYKLFWSNHITGRDRVYYNFIHNWGGQLKKFKSVAPSSQILLPCVALWSLMVIFANGDVPNCTVDYQSKYLVGNVSDKSIAELWQSEIYEKRRALHLSGKKNQIYICEKCNAWDDPSDIEKISDNYANAGL